MWRALPDAGSGSVGTGPTGRASATGGRGYSSGAEATERGTGTFPMRVSTEAPMITAWTLGPLPTRNAKAYRSPSRTVSAYTAEAMTRTGWRPLRLKLPGASRSPRTSWAPATGSAVAGGATSSAPNRAGAAVAAAGDHSPRTIAEQRARWLPYEVQPSSTRTACGHTAETMSAYRFPPRTYTAAPAMPSAAACSATWWAVTLPGSPIARS